MTQQQQQLCLISPHGTRMLWTNFSERYCQIQIHSRYLKNYLNIQNRIYGCSTVIYENSIDGKGFLNLDLTSLGNLGLTFIERCKINALLNSIAPEPERKEFIRRWVCQRKTSLTNHPSKTERSTNSQSSIPPVPHKPPYLGPNIPPQAKNSTPPIQKSKKHLSAKQATNFQVKL